MPHKIITTDRQLDELCSRLADAPRIAFDTEFVSEHTYRPVLCLVQVAAGGRLDLVDAMAVSDLTPFWEVLARPGHETIVHAGREELCFSLEAVGRPPAGLFDAQIAAGLVGYEYPAGYGSLLYKVLNETPKKAETRTDWRRRPLSDLQVEYALDDVRYLEPLRDGLCALLESLGRLAWMEAEMAAWQADVQTSRNRERWRRVGGSSGLNGRGLAIVRELWQWREEVAERRDCPPRRVLRDDLIVELARRRTADPHRIQAVRGLERGDLKRILPELSRAIQRALALPEEECPKIVYRETSPQLGMLGQFLSAALTSICRAAHLAPSIVGTPSDVRDLVAWRLEPQTNGASPPLLAQGWREEVVGQLLEDLLAGKVSIRIQDPYSDQPLAFE